MKNCLWCGKEFNPRKKTQETCSKSCAQKLRNKRRGYGKIITGKCAWCGKEIQYKKSSPRRFCSRSCMGKWKMSLPEFREKIHSLDARKKIAESSKIRMADPKLRKMHSERMKKNNPATRPEIMKKIIATKRINGTLHVWKGERGGNGKLTIPQKLLAAHLAWPTEYAISLGKRRKGYPTCYKVDLGNPDLKIAIEIDGKLHRWKKSISKDMKKTKALNQLGWKVLRFTNEEIMKDISKVLLEIKREIKIL